MNRKKELVQLRFFFKQKGLEYSHLEEKLGYGKGTLRSTIARGGTDALLLKLKELKTKLFPDATNAVMVSDNMAHEATEPYGNKSFNAEYIQLQGKLIDAQTELLKVKDENIRLVTENKELKERLRIVDKGNAERPTYVLPGKNEKKAAS